VQKSRYLASGTVGDFIGFKRAANLREVPNSPNHLAAVKGGVPIIGRALLLMNRVSLEGPRYDRNDREGADQPPQRETPAALLWDVVLSGAEPRWGLTYAFGVYNAFDYRWVVPISTEFRQTTMPQNGRTFLATGGITF
jgi:hypothetical protein